MEKGSIRIANYGSFELCNMAEENHIKMSALHPPTSSQTINSASPRPSKMTRIKCWIQSKISDTSDLDNAVDVVNHNAARARNSMSQAVGLIVQMDENLKEEEEILQQRANRLRRQSADAFKLMHDVSKIQQPNQYSSFNRDDTIDEEESHDEEACYKDNLHFVTELPNSPSYYAYVQDSGPNPLPEKKSKDKYLSAKEDKRYNRGKIERCKTVETSEDESEEEDDSHGRRTEKSQGKEESVEVTSIDLEKKDNGISIFNAKLADSTLTNQSDTKNMDHSQDPDTDITLKSFSVIEHF